MDTKTYANSLRILVSSLCCAGWGEERADWVLVLSNVGINVQFYIQSLHRALVHKDAIQVDKLCLKYLLKYVKS